MSELEEHHWVFWGALPDIPTASQLADLFDALLLRIGMTPLGERQIMVAVPEWRALQMIAESHIAAHGNGREGRVEVFSCKRFAVEEVADEIEGRLGGQWMAQRIKRALTPTEFPA